MMKIAKLFLLIVWIAIFCLTMSSCSGTTDPDEIDAPGNLQIQKISNFTLELSWEYEHTGSDTIVFQIARKVGNTAWIENFAELDSDVLKFNDDVFTSDSLAYAYKVRYYNYSQSITSEYSEIIAWLAPQTYPTNMVIDQISQEQLLITWKDHCLGEDGYIVDKKVNDSDWENEYLILDQDSEMFFDSVALFDSISYRIFAFVGISRTEYLSADKFSSLMPPSQVELSTPDLEFNKIRINWQDNSSGEAGFYIDKKIGFQDWQLQYASVDSNITTYVDDNLLQCAAIQYRLQAYKSEYLSSYSNMDTIFVNLEVISSYDTPGGALDITLPLNNDYIDDWTAFISDEYHGLAVIDCQNPLMPNNITTYSDLWGDRTLSAFIHGNFVYVANQSLADAAGGIQKVDIANLEAPVISNVTPTNGIPKKLFVEGDHAYLAEGENGLSIIYVASSFPVFINNIDLYDARSVQIVEINGNIYAFVANGLNQGFVIVDLTDPLDPQTISSYQIDGLACDIMVNDSFVYLANGEEGMAVFDVSDLENPNLIKTIQTSGYVNGVFAENNYVYISDVELGFFVIDSQIPAEAYILGNLFLNTQPRSLHLSGSYVYMTDNQGLKIIKVKP